MDDLKMRFLQQNESGINPSLVFIIKVWVLNPKERKSEGVKCICGGALILRIPAVICWPLCSDNTHTHTQTHISLGKYLQLKHVSQSKCKNEHPHPVLHSTQHWPHFWVSDDATYSFTPAHIQTRSSSVPWVCKQLWIIAFTDALCVTRGLWEEHSWSYPHKRR